MKISSAVRPAPGEYLEYYGRYISRIQENEALPALERQGASMISFLRGLSEAQGALRYAPEKWSVKQVLGHVADGERVFAYRALRFGRGDFTPLPGFEENQYVAMATFDLQPLSELVDHLEFIRKSTLLLFRSFEDAAWTRQGEAADAGVSVRALAFIIAGHGDHHMNVLKERYLGAGSASAAKR